MISKVVKSIEKTHPSKQLVFKRLGLKYTIHQTKIPEWVISGIV
jgi:hypothetical protein